MPILLPLNKPAPKSACTAVVVPMLLMMVVEFGSTAAAEMSVFQAFVAGKGTKPPRVVPTPVASEEQDVLVEPVLVPLVSPVPLEVVEVLAPPERLQPDSIASERRSALSLSITICQECAFQGRRIAKPMRVTTWVTRAVSFGVEGVRS